MPNPALAHVPPSHTTHRAVTLLVHRPTVGRRIVIPHNLIVRDVQREWVPSSEQRGGGGEGSTQKCNDDCTAHDEPENLRGEVVEWGKKATPRGPSDLQKDR